MIFYPYHKPAPTPPPNTGYLLFAVQGPDKETCPICVKPHALFIYSVGVFNCHFCKADFLDSGRGFYHLNGPDIAL